jgi:hypothetical protein
MKSAMVAAAGVSSLVVMGVGAWLGYGTPFPPPRPPADSGSTRSAGGAHLDAGSCNANDDARACDCCFTMANEIRCTVGVAPPDAGVLTMPRCRGGK